MCDMWEKQAQTVCGPSLPTLLPLPSSSYHDIYLPWLAGNHLHRHLLAVMLALCSVSAPGWVSSPPTLRLPALQAFTVFVVAAYNMALQNFLL